MAKSGVINEGMIRAKDASERLNLQKENARIQSYKDLQTISDSVTKIMGIVEQGLAMLGSLISTLTPFINQAADFMKKFLKSPMVRGVKGLFGGSDE